MRVSKRWLRMCRKALVPFQFRWIIPHIVMLPLGGRVCVWVFSLFHIPVF